MWAWKSRPEVFDLLRVRGALDEVAAELAAQCHEPDALEAIGQANERFSELAMRPVFSAAIVDQVVEADIQLHAAIAAASGSPLVAKLLSDLNDSLAQSRRVILSHKGRARASVAEHNELVRAILASEPRKAKLAAERHWASVRASVSGE